MGQFGKKKERTLPKFDQKMQKIDQKKQKKSAKKQKKSTKKKKKKNAQLPALRAEVVDEIVVLVARFEEFFHLLFRTKCAEFYAGSNGAKLRTHVKN
jgi:hypothetical protein